MRGKNYLLISSILIIAAAFAGFTLNILSVYPRHYTGVFRSTWFLVCLLNIIAGILGIIDRSRPAAICIAAGIILFVISIASLPLLFITGRGSAPVDLVIIILLNIFASGFYLNGAFMNRKKPSGYTFKYNIQ